MKKGDVVINKNKVVIDPATVAVLMVNMYQFLFVALKLSGVISWNWFWVLSPAIIGIVILPLIALLVGFVFSRTKKVKRGEK